MADVYFLEMIHQFDDVVQAHAFRQLEVETDMT